MSFEGYKKYISENREVKYSADFRALPETPAEHRWVGAQCAGKCIYGIPNDMGAVLKYAEGEVSYLGDAGSLPFKWTGGCIWNGYLYGFPRTENRLLKMPLDRELPEYVPLGQGQRYPGEHHYGGACTEDGIVYQPPRESDHLLVWDLKTEEARRIYLAAEEEERKLRYCGSILHPDGYLYVLPEMGGRIVRLDIRTEEWTFIGIPMDTMVFDAKVAIDGNIYGYSAYCRGILKIDTATDDARMIHEEISPGAYGTKLGVNGHLYSVPGDGDAIWDYDPLTDSLESIYRFPDKKRAKFAGGASLRNGDIYAVPARDNRILHLRADAEGLKIPADIYAEYFSDCY